MLKTLGLEVTNLFFLQKPYDILRYCPTHLGKGDTAQDLTGKSYGSEDLPVPVPLGSHRHFRVKFFRSTAPRHREKCQQAAMAAADGLDDQKVMGDF